MHLPRLPSIPAQLFKRSFIHITTRSRSTLPSQIQPGASEHKVILDGQTLYIDQHVAEALGWTHKNCETGVKLMLHGWAPGYFAVTREGSDAERLARSTVESSRNGNVKGVLDYLKDR